MRSLTAWSLAALCLLSSAATATEVRLHHRISRGHGDQPKPNYTFRGTVTLDDQSGSAKYEGEGGHSKLDMGRGGFHDCCLYEVALEKPGVSPEQWSFASTKACFLSSHVSDSLAIVTDNAGVPLSLNYYITNVPPSGTCPPHSAPPSHHGQTFHATPQFAHFTNTTISVRRPSVIRPPILKTPPPLSAEGTPIVPPPEKSFIQKYWIYIVPIFLLMLLAPEDDQGAAKGDK